MNKNFNLAFIVYLDKYFYFKVKIPIPNKSTTQAIDFTTAPEYFLKCVHFSIMTS